MKRALIILGAFCMAIAAFSTGLAETCSVYVDPVTGNIVQVCFGDGEGGCGENCDPPPPPACDPGTTTIMTQYVPNPADPATCHLLTMEVDICTGVILWSSTDYDESIACEANSVEDPCDEFSWDGGGFTCRKYCDPGWNWGVTSRVGFPEMFLDVRPFPVTLVRWPTAMRASLIPVSQGTGQLGYAPLGGGEAGDPAVGDWRNLRLTLRLVPATNFMLVELPKIGSLSLPAVGESGAPLIFQWEVPSHPEVGGNVLAGSISGLEKVPADLPVFQGSGGALYRLFWSFHYEEYTRRCRPGAADDGDFECKTRGGLDEKDGHYEYRWRSRTQSGEIHPSAVQGLPPGWAVDLNGDGSPDAYWNSSLTLRRMDEANRVDNPVWARSWNWGGAIYWGVREGQGQIGWPGNP